MLAALFEGLFELLFWALDRWSSKSPRRRRIYLAIWGVLVALMLVLCVVLGARLMWSSTATADRAVGLVLLVLGLGLLVFFGCLAARLYRSPPSGE